VLGAGASAFAGYPLASELLPFVRQSKMVGAQSAQIAQDVLWKLNTAELQFQKHIVRDPNKSTNLEDLLTHLELHGHIQGMLHTVGPWTPQDRAKITRTISEAFLVRQYELNVAAWKLGDRRDVF
jgi:hypothetical protein